MRVVFVSNYLNHHQIPFCRAMNQRLEGEFTFIQTQPVEEERLKMGWSGEIKEPYLRLYYEEEEPCRKLIHDAEVVIFGGTDDESYVQERLREGKTILRYMERLYKTGQWKAISPRGLRKKYLDHVRYRSARVYLLCAGGYVPSDFHLIGAYPGKMFCWGYFPETKRLDLDKVLEEKGWQTEGGERIPYLLWSGRMIDWKHPELAIETAKYLQEKGIDFHLDMIGGGTLEENLKALAERYGLKGKVSFPGFMTPDKVREHMEKADVYLLTSDRQEGWGAVANEAMNSACALVADHMVGAAPYLIRHGKNGCVYRDGDVQELFRTVEELVNDPEKRRELGRNAYETIQKDWNSENAAEKLCELLKRIQGEGGADVYSVKAKDIMKGDGGAGRGFVPCQPAPVISEREMYHFLTGQRR